MTVDLDFVRWLADQTEEVVTNVAPLLATILDVDKDLVIKFASYIKEASEAVINAIEAFLEFKAVFGSDGSGLTDAAGCSYPDCPCPQEFESVIWALKARA